MSATTWYSIKKEDRYKSDPFFSAANLARVDAPRSRNTMKLVMGTKGDQFVAHTKQGNIFGFIERMNSAYVVTLDALLGNGDRWQCRCDSAPGRSQGQAISAAFSAKGFGSGCYAEITRHWGIAWCKAA